MSSEFKEKDEVFVGSLQKLGRITGLPKPGWYEVSVGGLKIQCRASDLKSPKGLSKSLLKTLKRIAKPVAGSAKSPPTRPATLDLHGLIVEDALRALEKAVDRAIIEGHSRMEIVHGIGSGRVRQAVHSYLKGLSVVESFKIDDINPGVTWVYF